jgi:hypothetical protein
MKPSDLVVLCKIFTYQKGSGIWTYSLLSSGTYLSVGEVHASVKRLKASGLYNEVNKTAMVSAMEEFLIHGVKYAFPAERGPVVRGVPTSHSAPVFRGEMSQSDEDAYVWPYAYGNAKGSAISPLSDGAPKAALEDRELYDILALVDALRIGRARERNIAKEKLKSILGGGKKT